MPKKAVKNKKWFEAGAPLGWRKEYSQTRRRELALRSRRGKYLETARALQALANITQDSETSRKAATDAAYFFRLYRKQQLERSKR